MENSDRRYTGNISARKRILAGAFLVIAFAQLFFFTNVAQGLYPNYSVRMNFISDLGVQPESAFLWSASMLISGILVIAASLLLYTKEKTENYYTIVAILLTGIGIAGVAVFNENTFRIFHIFFASLAFAFGGVTAILYSRSIHGLLKYISLILGGLIIVGIVFLAGSFLIPSIGNLFLSIGPGYAERMVAYPEAVWFMAFGAYLIGSTTGILR